MTESGLQRPALRRPKPPAIIRHSFLAILALWVVMPFALGNHVAQDAVPYLAAGRVASHHPRDIYAAQHGQLTDLRPRFKQTWCDIAPSGTDCASLATAFVATPPTITLSIVLARLGNRWGALIMQLGSSLMLAGGMWLLWEYLANRTRVAGILMLATAVLLTPMAMVPIGLGQTSPILFLSICVGLHSVDRRHRLAAALVWTLAVLTKVFPAGLIALLVWRRSWRFLGWSGLAAGGASLVTFLVVPFSTWRDFYRTTLDLSSTTALNPYNGSFSALLNRAVPGSQTHGVPALLVAMITVIAAAAICWFGMRGVDDDTRWAVGYVALLFITPLVWWHYVWVAIGALGIVLAGQRRLTDRTLAILPAVALISAIPSIPNARGWSMPVVQALFLIAVTVIILVLADRQRRQRAGANRPSVPTEVTSA